MKKDKLFSEFSLEQSQYDNIHDKEIKDQELKQLLKVRTKFTQFILNPVNNQSLRFGASSTSKYSKQIKQGTFDGKIIGQLINKRVDKMIKNQRIKKNWCKDDCTILAWVLGKLTHGRHLKCPEKLKQIYWEQAANLIPGTTAQQCKFKWLSMKKSKLTQNKWSEQQSKLLQKIVKQYGNQDWKTISRILYQTNPSNDKKYRNSKQCREQWNCYLNPKLKKGSWSIDQDIKLLNLVLKYGKHWSLLKKSQINTRTQNALKNRYNFIIQKTKPKYIKIHQHISQQALTKFCLQQSLKIKALQQQKQKQKAKISASILLQQKQSKQQQQNQQQYQYQEQQQIQEEDLQLQVCKRKTSNLLRETHYTNQNNSNDKQNYNLHLEQDIHQHQSQHQYQNQHQHLHQHQLYQNQLQQQQQLHQNHLDQIDRLHQHQHIHQHQHQENQKQHPKQIQIKYLKISHLQQIIFNSPATTAHPLIPAIFTQNGIFPYIYKDQ